MHANRDGVQLSGRGPVAGGPYCYTSSYSAGSAGLFGGS